MKQFTKHPSKVTAAADILSFKCPGCRNKTLYSTEQDVHRAADVDENELFICDECGGEFRAHPQYDGSIRFTESIESATDVDKIPEFNDWLYDKYGVGDSDMSDDDWEYYHDKYLKETGQAKYMSGNVYSSKQSGVRRKSTHRSVTAAKKRITGSYAMEDEMKRFLEWNMSQADNHIANKHAVEVDYPVMVEYFEANPDVYVDLFHGFLFPKDARYADIFSKMKLLGYKPRSTGYISRGVFDPAMTIDVPDKDIPKDLEDALDKYPELDIRRVTYHKGAAGNIKLKFILEDTAFASVRDNARYKGTSASEKRTDDSISESSRNVKAATYPEGTYWMAKYKDMNGNLHKIVFQFDSQDFDEAEEEMDAVIPEPYTKARLLGKAPSRSAAEHDGFVIVGCDATRVTSSEDVDDYEDDIQEISQEFTSENTSINSGKLPAIFKMVHLEPGTINIDYGGGKFDNVAEYLAPMDVVNLVYDPYNRTPEHNKEVLRTIRKAGGADSATCSNVLNVIKEPEVRRNVLENIRRVVKPEGVVYITVYEGSGRGNEGPTKSGYQLNRKTADYLDEIKEVFPDAIRKGKLIIAHPNESVASSVECAADVSKKDLLFLAKKAADVITAEDLEEIISSLLSVDKKLYTKYSEEARSEKSPAAIGKDISNDLYWMTQDDEVTAANCGDATITSASSVSMKAIHDRILNAASKRLQKSDMGFPLSEIADYLVVEEKETEDGALKIEVRCELSYEGMRKLAEALDPIVARYDKDAYFDMVAPGIMEAFIFNRDIRADSFSSVTADNRNFPEPPLEPPNYDEPKQNNTTDYIVVDLDDDIIVEDNSIDFAADPSFYQASEEWVVEFATDTTLDDPDSVAEHVLELILPQIPDEPGLYRVKGRVTLAYDVSYSSTFRQESFEDGYEDIDESSVDASFNFKKSEINKLEVGRD